MVEAREIRQTNYHTFDRGSLFSTCKKTDAYGSVAEKFMNHHRPQMATFTVRKVLVDCHLFDPQAKTVAMETGWCDCSRARIIR